jgi:hypothetical protein
MFFCRFDDGAGGDNEVQRTMLELINQLDGFDPRGNIKVNNHPFGGFKRFLLPFSSTIRHLHAHSLYETPLLGCPFTLIITLYITFIPSNNMLKPS